MSCLLPVNDGEARRLSLASVPAARGGAWVWCSVVCCAGGRATVGGLAVAASGRGSVSRARCRRPRPPAVRASSALVAAAAMGVRVSTHPMAPCRHLAVVRTASFLFAVGLWSLAAWRRRHHTCMPGVDRLA